jgi:hypothetical protein
MSSVKIRSNAWCCADSSHSARTRHTPAVHSSHCHTAHTVPTRPPHDHARMHSVSSLTDSAALYSRAEQSVSLTDGAPLGAVCGVPCRYCVDGSRASACLSNAAQNSWVGVRLPVGARIAYVALCTACRPLLCSLPFSALRPFPWLRPSLCTPLVTLLSALDSALTLVSSNRPSAPTRRLPSALSCGPVMVPTLASGVWRFVACGVWRVARFSSARQ